MDTQKPIILNQAELDWEGWDGPGVTAEGPLRWKILISGERGPSSRLTTGIAEMTPGALLPLHHHEPEETYYVVSGHGHVRVDASRGITQSRFICLYTLKCEAFTPMHGHREIGFPIHLRSRPV